MRQIVLTRALGVETLGALDPILARMPEIGGTNAGDSSAGRALLWQSFFRGALLTIGRSRSPEPLALHYNPLSDVGLVQRCAESDAEPLSCRDVCAFPGEILMGGERAGPAPGWLADRTPLSAIVDTARARIETFANKHPFEGTNTADWSRAYCRREWQAIAELRQLRALRTLHDVDRAALEGALAAYRDASSRKIADERIDFLLSHASQFSLVGAVNVTAQHRMLLFAPRKSAWYMIAVLMGPSGASLSGGQVLLDATVLSFARGG